MDHDITVSADDRYRLLVDAISDCAIYMLDPNGLVASWNMGAQRFKGYSADEVLGKHFSQFYVPEDREKGLPQKALDAALVEGRFEGEGWRQRKDGTRFWAHVNIDPIWDSKRKILGFAKVTRDLTERKNAEEQLRRTEEQFRLLVQGVTDYALYMMDTEGHVVSWNVGAQRIKGYQPDEIIGKHFSQFYTDADKQAGVPRRALSVARSEGRFEAEGWRLRKDGSRFWANVVIDAIRGETGELLGFAKITRDVTEKREAEKALEAAREAFFQAQKMEAVGQLTGGVAHDFNNLLMVIQGSLELLKKRLPQTPEIAPILDNALQAAQRGASLTQRMLAFSRKQELNLEPVDVIDLLHGMTDLMQRSLGPEILVESHYAPSLPPVRTDPNQLASAILNLAINARDAMPHGGPLTVTVRAATRAEAEQVGLTTGDFVCLSIADEGEGMDEQTLAEATTPFFTTKGVGKGTGLGLPVVEGLMAQSHGKLVLRSRKGEGTTAELWLPVAEAEVLPAPEQPAPESERPLQPLTILAVDDDPLVLMNTVMMLEDMGHRVIDATSASEALDKFASQSIDLVITDQAMPRMTGTELAKNLRERRPELPIILATGYAELPTDAAPDLVKLSKPFGDIQLANAVALSRSPRQ